MVRSTNAAPGARTVVSVIDCTIPLNSSCSTGTISSPISFRLDSMASCGSGLTVPSETSSRPMPSTSWISLIRPSTVSGLPYSGGPITIGGAIDGSILTCFGTPPSAAPIWAIVIMTSGVAPLKMLTSPPPRQRAHRLVRLVVGRGDVHEVPVLQVVGRSAPSPLRQPTGGRARRARRTSRPLMYENPRSSPCRPAKIAPSLLLPEIRIARMRVLHPLAATRRCCGSGSSGPPSRTARAR